MIVFIRAAQFKETNSIQKGFGLVECLVVLIIISTALVAANIFNMGNLQNLRESKNRVFVSSHVAEIAELIRANPKGARNNYYQAMKAPVATSNCLVVRCNAQELAKYQVSEWFNNMPGTLPNVNASISSVIDDQISVVVRWDNDNSGSRGTQCPPQSENDLDCVKLILTL